MPARATDPLTFAISPTLPNRPVLPEIDRLRQREIRRWLLIGALVVGAALFDGYQRYTVVARGYQFESVQLRRAQEEARARRLRLEILTLTSPKQIEPWARSRLNLVPPGPADAIVLQRVVAPDAPPSSVVASR